ncbi:MAG: hypothetical protein ABI624_14695, partial [Casimicrobiaceae bacterium]
MNQGKRALLLVGALAAILPFGVASVEAATITTPVTGVSPGMSGGSDQLIDALVAQRVAAEKLSADGARVAREQVQLQFLSLTGAEQQRLVALVRDNGAEAGGERASMVMSSLVQGAARQAMASVQAAQRAARGQTKIG